MVSLTGSLSLSLSHMYHNWQEVVKRLQILKKKLGEEDYSVLREIRETVLKLQAPTQLVCYLFLPNTFILDPCMFSLDLRLHRK